MTSSPSSSATLKRKLSNEAPISPPQLKRKLQSGTTQNAVASFFTPTSKKPPERVTWAERGVNDDSPATLLVGKYTPTNWRDGKKGEEATRRKVAAFDFVSGIFLSRTICVSFFHALRSSFILSHDKPNVYLDIGLYIG